MNDRELLELAAKAAGVTVTGQWSDSDRMYANTDQGWWNPLTDDGDALRLAVQLGAHIMLFKQRMEPYVRVRIQRIVKEEELRDDSNNATRRAIVRAAAEIGRAM